MIIPNMPGLNSTTREEWDAIKTWSPPSADDRSVLDQITTMTPVPYPELPMGCVVPCAGPVPTLKELLEAKIAEDKASTSRRIVVTSTPEGSALDTQVGGAHYKGQAIQPVEYIHANGLGFCEGNVVKYITRWKAKGGIQDLKKVIHYVELLIDLEAKNPSAMVKSVA